MKFEGVCVRELVAPSQILEGMLFLLVLLGARASRYQGEVKLVGWGGLLAHSPNILGLLYAVLATPAAPTRTRLAQLSHVVVVGLLLCPTGDQGRRVARPSQGESRGEEGARSGWC